MVAQVVFSRSRPHRGHDTSSRARAVPQRRQEIGRHAAARRSARAPKRADSTTTVHPKSLRCSPPPSAYPSSTSEYPKSSWLAGSVVRSTGVRVLAVAVFSSSRLGAVTLAQAAVQAPELSLGPRVVSGGLLWSTEAGVCLSTATSTRLLVPGVELRAVLGVEDGWTILAQPSGPKVGKIGGRLSAVGGFRRCPPVRSHEGADAVDGVANGELYAVVPAGCLGRRPPQGQFLVRVKLGMGKLHVIGRVPRGAISLAAAGPRVALAYGTGQRGPDLVKVVDSRSARVLYTLSPPAGEARSEHGETEIDSKGDVLVTSPLAIARGPIYVATPHAWWGDARTPVGHPLVARFGASLSEGRIAYIPPGEGEGERIDVLNLETDTTRTIVTFSGSARLQGVGLGRSVLAWAQQSYAYRLDTVGLGLAMYSCAGSFPTGPAELTETPLSASALPITVTASPGPRPAGQSCVYA
jgi:hypothetical protein